MNKRISMVYFWISFSYKGKNQGCCIIEESDKSLAYLKAEKLKIIPKSDHIFVTQCEKQELECDVLILPDKLKELGYENIKN